MVNKYYQKHKGRLQKEARERYQNLSVEEKDKTKKRPRKVSKFYQKRKSKKASVLSRTQPKAS